MAITNKPLFYLIVSFIVLNIVDIITTMFIITGESNPIFHFTGSIIPVFALKIIISGVIILFYRRAVYSSNGSYFLFITTLVYICVALLIAQINNIHAMMNPAILDAAAKATQAEKVSSYVTFMNLIYLMPIIFSWVSFTIYDKSRDKVTVDKNYLKKKGSWWKI